MTIDPRSDQFDPTLALAQVTESTGLLIRQAETLDDEAVREPSLLPRWTRGLVLTHIARNADALGNLLVWAETGERHDMYPSREHRNAGIEAGANRSAAQLTADLQEASQRFLEAAARLSPDRWAAPVERTATQQPYPARFILWWRYQEILVHHVDLGAGFSPAHWPADFTGPELEIVAADMSDPARNAQGPGFRLHAEDTARDVGVQCDPADGSKPLVRGPEPGLLAWLIGRSGGDGLTVDPAGALPAPPPWL
jgi:maleylpyruvate isomerase